MYQKDTQNSDKEFFGRQATRKRCENNDEDSPSWLSIGLTDWRLSRPKPWHCNTNVTFLKQSHC